MKPLTVALLLCLTAAPLPEASAQTTAPPAAPDKGLAVAPQAAPAANPASGEANSAQAAGPANICQELVAFLQKKAAAPQPAAKPAQPGPNPVTSAAGASVQASGQPAPIPQAPASGGPASDPLAEATALTNANDLRGCQNTVRKMRRAGADIPPALLALAALKPELLGPSGR